MQEPGEQPGEAPAEAPPAQPSDSNIVSLTDENGVNSLIGRKIETPQDWLEARKEYAKLEMAGLEEGAGWDRGELVKSVIVVTLSVSLGLLSREPAKDAGAASSQ